MFEEENKGFGEKIRDFLYSLVMVVGLCAICGFVAYFLVGCSKKQSAERSVPNKKIEELVINSDYKEDTYVTIIDENGKTFFEYYGLVNITEKDGQQNIIIDLRKNEGE